MHSVRTAIGAMPRLVLVGSAVLALLLLDACKRPSFQLGDECQLNTDCPAPLVCRLGHCRVECRAQRDCEMGLECVRDEHGLGVCQLPSETDCELTSECPTPLVCRFGRCTNECETNRDCLPGQICREEDGGGRGCGAESEVQCTLNSDCPGGLICAADRRCHPPCRTDWDCDDGRTCIMDVTPTVCGWPDAGVMDGGAGLDGGRTIDASSIDASTDGGADATRPSDAGTPPPPPTPPTLAAGLQNTCAAPASGSPRCWGSNDSGQIGDGTMFARLTATSVMGLGTVAILDVGQAFACATAGSGLSCWGDNTHGQLGTGLTTPSSTPVSVSGLPSGAVEDLALGVSHTCAIVAGTLYCWGANDAGQLGLGDTVERHSPVAVTGLSGRPVQVDTNAATTCVRLERGSIECFGENGYGQVDSSAEAHLLTPTPVPGLTDAISVAAGTTHTCAIRSDRTVWCWGNDTLGQIGNGGTFGDPQVGPTPTLSVPAPVLQLVAGSTHACARTASALYCWGDNGSLQCGQSPSVSAAFGPMMVPGLGAVEEVAVGETHTCVRISAGSYSCFGANNYGQLGDGSMTESSTPVAVTWP